MDFEKQKHESVETPREWVLKEAEFQTKAIGAILGLLIQSKEGQRLGNLKKDNPHTFFEKSDSGIVTTIMSM